mgnify:CR=1 FL=1
MNRLRTASAAALACFLFVACEVPTDPPLLKQRWIVPIEEVTLSVDQLLPTGVTVAGDDFSVSIDPFNTAKSLAIICGACVDLNGLTAPAPSFSTLLTASGGLPADVSAAVISSANIEVAVQNGLSFDPTTGGGSLTITIYDGQDGTTLGEVVVDPATGPMIPGGTLTRTISVGPSSIGATLFAAVAVVSVGGQVALINTANQITVTTTTTSMLVSAATVNVGSQSVDFDPEPLDVEDIDNQLVDRIQEASLLLDIVNPFGVSVSATIVIGPTSKALSIDTGATSSTSITYTNSELQSWLGQPGITFSGSGVASGESITVSARDELTIQVTLDATIQIG